MTWTGDDPKGGRVRLDVREIREKVERIVDLTDHNPDAAVQEAHDLASDLWVQLGIAER